jgi:hypothetical protein
LTYFYFRSNIVSTKGIFLSDITNYWYVINIQSQIIIEPTIDDFYANGILHCDYKINDTIMSLKKKLM